MTFRLDAWPTDDALRRTRPPRVRHPGHVPVGGDSAIRVSVGCFNTEAEISHFVEAVALLAAHTPDSLPRRPSLTILHEAGS